MRFNRFIRFSPSPHRLGDLGNWVVVFIRLKVQLKSTILLVIGTHGLAPIY